MGYIHIQGLYIIISSSSNEYKLLMKLSKFIVTGLTFPLVSEKPSER